MQPFTGNVFKWVKISRVGRKTLFRQWVLKTNSNLVCLELMHRMDKQCMNILQFCSMCKACTGYWINHVCKSTNWEEWNSFRDYHHVCRSFDNNVGDQCSIDNSDHILYLGSRTEMKKTKTIWTNCFCFLRFYKLIRTANGLLLTPLL